MFRIRKRGGSHRDAPHSGEGGGNYHLQRQSKKREVAHSVTYLGHTLMDNVRSASDITHERMLGNHAGFAMRTHHGHTNSADSVANLRLLADSHGFFLVQPAHVPHHTDTGGTHRRHTLGRDEVKDTDRAEREVMHLQLPRVVDVHAIDCHLYIVVATEAAVRRHSSHPNLSWRRGNNGEQEFTHAPKSYAAPRTVFYCHCLAFQSPAKPAKVKRTIHKYQNKLAKEQARAYRKNRKHANRQRATARRSTFSFRRVFRRGAATLTRPPSSSPASSVAGARGATRGTATRVPNRAQRLGARVPSTSAAELPDYRPRAFTTTITPPPSAPAQKTRTGVPVAGMPLSPRPQTSPATTTISTRTGREQHRWSCALPGQMDIDAAQAPTAHSNSSGISSTRDFGGSTTGRSKPAHDAEAAGHTHANHATCDQRNDDSGEELLYDAATMVGMSTATCKSSGSSKGGCRDGCGSHTAEGSGCQSQVWERPTSTPPNSAFPLYNVPMVQSLPGSVMSVAALMSSEQSSGVSSRTLSRHASTDRPNGRRSRTPVSEQDSYLQPQQLQAKINSYKQQRHQQQAEQQRHQQQAEQQQQQQQAEQQRHQQQAEQQQAEQQQAEQQQQQLQELRRRRQLKQMRRYKAIAERQEANASDTDSLDFGFGDARLPTSPHATLPPKPVARREAPQQPQQMRERAVTVTGNERKPPSAGPARAPACSRPLPPLPAPPAPPPRRCSTSNGAAARALSALQSRPLPPPPTPPQGEGRGQQATSAMSAVNANQHMNEQRVAASGEPSWYLGAVSSQTASKVLGNAPVGAFVVHVRAAQRGYEYVVSVKAANKKVEQAIFVRGPDGAFQLPDGRLSAHSLAGFAFAAMKSRHPLPGTTTPLVTPR